MPGHIFHLVSRLFYRLLHIHFMILQLFDHGLIYSALF